MNDSPRKEVRYSDRQRREAAQWFVDIHHEDPSPELLQDWLRWLDAAESHRLAFAAVEAAWQATPDAVGASADLADRQTPNEPDYDPGVPVAEWLRQRSARAPQRGPYRWRALRVAALAATLVALLGAGAWFLGHPERYTHPSSGEFLTRTGEHMQLVLADGSRVTLGARSRLSVRFSRNVREIDLDTGEAFFSVRKDPRRPFSVHALGGVITAVGTAFNVRTMADEVTVVVADGVVNVTHGQPQAGLRSAAVAPVRVHRGEQLTFTTQISASMPQDQALTHVDPTQSARWRDGWLVYRNEPLRYVVADVARYTDREISVGDAVSHELRFTGAVFKDSVVEWVEALPEVFPVSVQDDGADVTINAASGAAKATTR